MHTYIQRNTYIPVRTYIYMHIYTHTYIHIPTYILTYIYTYIHIYLHIYIHTYIHTYIHPVSRPVEGGKVGEFAPRLVQEFIKVRKQDEVEAILASLICRSYIHTYINTYT